MTGPILRCCAALAAVALLTSCGPTKRAAPQKASLVQPDCYTVDPYKKLRIAKPAKSLPDRMRAFLGGWGGGAWGGAVCHDLYVLKVEPTGDAILFDAHGPGFSTDATAFTRRGVIGEDGRLRVRKGSAKVEYWIEDGRLHGVRKQGHHTTQIILTPKA